MLPKRLQPGDTIGIVSPSKNLNDERKAKLQSAIEVLGRDFDLRVKLGKHVYDVDKYGCSAGSPEQKAEDILLDVARGYDFPILKINEFGHKCPNTPLAIGGAGEMDVEAKSFKIISPCVQ